MTKDPLTHALIGHAMKAHSDLGPRWLHLPWGIAFHFGRQQTDIRVVSNPISKASIPQIQGQPQIETDQDSSDLGSTIPTTELQGSSQQSES